MCFGVGNKLNACAAVAIMIVRPDPLRGPEFWPISVGLCATLHANKPFTIAVNQRCVLRRGIVKPTAS